MVFRCGGLCVAFTQGTKHETRTQTMSTTVETFHTAQSHFDSSQTDKSAIPDSKKRSDLPSIAEASSNLRVFSLAELKAATGDFDSSSKIGEGGFGIVYRGVIKSSKNPRREIKVAVKKQKDTGSLAEKQWVTEVIVLGKIEHPNLVKLLGYCVEEDASGTYRLLVYEYMPKGSLEDWLSGQTKTRLSWPMRHRLAIGAASGLAYLHDCRIILRDFKPSNILLDDQWNAKLSDFGCARLGPSEDETHVTTRVSGTYPYVAPEYKATGHLRASSDVWSYGVFLYELIIGERPSNPNLPRNEQSLAEPVNPDLEDEQLRLIVSSVEGHFPLQSAKELLRIADECLLKNHELRPKMSDVLHQLRQVIPKSSLETQGKRRFACLSQLCSWGK